MRESTSKKVSKQATATRKRKQAALKQTDESDETEPVFFSGAGVIVARLRADRGWTQEQLATLVGVNRSTLCRYESDELPLSDRMIKRFAKAFQMKELDLMRDCLFHIRRKLKKSPFGKFISQLAKATRDG